MTIPTETTETTEDLIRQQTAVMERQAAAVEGTTVVAQTVADEAAAAIREERLRARLEMHSRGILHAMELLPEFAQGKVTDEGLNAKLTAAMKIYRAAMNGALMIEAEQERARNGSA